MCTICNLERPITSTVQLDRNLKYLSESITTNHYLLELDAPQYITLKQLLSLRGVINNSIMHIAFQKLQEFSITLFAVLFLITLRGIRDLYCFGIVRSLVKLP